MMKDPRSMVFYAFIICLCLLKTTLAYDGDTCCQFALDEKAFINSAVPLNNLTCHQQYQADKPAAYPVYVSYEFCASKCSGIGLSKPMEPKQWAAPLVQFILPSVIFSMSIPRRKKIAYDYMFDWPRSIAREAKWLWLNGLLQLSISLICFTIIIIPVILDTLIWVFIIVVGAGNMLVGALYEALLDYRIIEYVKEISAAGNVTEKSLEIQRELLVTIVSGNLMLEEGSPQNTIVQSLTLDGEDTAGRQEKARSRLLNLLGAQYSFGSTVGSPVVFYLGAFAYTILDLRNNPSDQDAAISLSFGIEWMIIVHVAIVSGCLLASNNPSTSSGIVGGYHGVLNPQPRRSNTFLSILRPGGAQETLTQSNGDWFCEKVLGWSDAYPTEFQPVSLWSRGINKMEWVKASKSWVEDQAFRKHMRVSFLDWVFKMFVPTFFLISVPPAAGAVVAYYTPPIGHGCRSLSLTVYACAQVAVSIIAFIRNSVDDGHSTPWKWKLAKTTYWADFRNNVKWLLRDHSFWAISGIFWFASLVAAVGGTTLQITGVYRNCVCYTSAADWLKLNVINPAVQLASDTQEDRDSSVYWEWMGSMAIIFMAVVCYIGWWYQKLIRRRFTDAIADLYVRSIPDPDRPSTSRNSSVDNSGDHSSEHLLYSVRSDDPENRNNALLAPGDHLDPNLQPPNSYQTSRDGSPSSGTSAWSPPDMRVTEELGYGIAMEPLLSRQVPKRRPVPRSNDS